MMSMRRAILALVLAAAATPARADFASEALLHDFVRSIDEAELWSASVRVVRSEGAQTIAEGLVLSRQTPDVTLTIDRLRLADLEEGEDGGFSASQIELSGGALRSEGLDYRVPSASVGDVEIPATAALNFDPHRLMSFMAQSYGLLAEAEFATFSVPEMTIEQHQPAVDGTAPVGATVTYRNLASEGLSGGILSESSAGPIDVVLQAPDGEVRFEVKSVAAERLDFGAVAHILDQSQYRDGRGDGIWRPLLSGVSYSGISGTGPGGATFRLDEIALENVDGRQADKPFVATWDRILDPDVQEEAKRDLALEALRDMYSAWRLGTFRLDGLSFAVPRENVSASLEAFTLSGLSLEGIDSVILKAFRASGPEGFGALDSFEMAGFLFPNLDALVKFAALEKDASPERHEETMRAAFASLPRVTHVGLRGLSGGRSESESVAVDLVSLDFHNWNEFFAEESDLRIEGVAIPVRLMQLNPEQLQIMNTLGFDRLVLGLSMADRWSLASGIDTGTWGLTLRDGADLEFSYSISGVTADWMLNATAAAGREPDSPEAFLRMLNGLSLDRARLAVTDRSLLDRGFAVAAELQGLDVEGKAYREQMRGALPFLLSAALPADLAKLVSAPLQAFMAGGQSLIADAAPAAPVPIPELVQSAGDPMGLLGRLGVTLRSEAPAQ